MASDAEGLILEVCKKYPDGVDDETLHREVGQRISLQERVDTINKLLKSLRIELFSSPDGLVYKLVNLEQVVKFRGLTPEDILVYQAIEQVGNSGIWTRDLKRRTNLSQPAMNKILKSLEQRHLVKTFRPVENKTRKMYILFTLEPSEHLTGGAWYTATEKDTEFIEVLRKACFRKIQLSGTASLAEISTFIVEARLSRVHLREENVKSVLDTLVYEGRVDEVDTPDGTTHYRPALLSLPERTPLTAIPCGVCPVMQECRPGAAVSPELCTYFNEWLEF